MRCTRLLELDSEGHTTHFLAHQILCISYRTVRTTTAAVLADVIHLRGAKVIDSVCTWGHVEVTHHNQSWEYLRNLSHCLHDMPFATRTADSIGAVTSFERTGPCHWSTHPLPDFVAAPWPLVTRNIQVRDNGDCVQ